MREKNFQTLFSTWVKENKIYIFEEYGDAIVWELKICKEKSIRFDDVKPHQVEALLEAQEGGVYHKINDMPFIPDNPKMRFTNKKPFDCFFIAEGLGFVVIWFYEKGQRVKDREMILIDINTWVKEECIAKKEGRKSVRVEYLKTIGRVEKFCCAGLKNSV